MSKYLINAAFCVGFTVIFFYVTKDLILTIAVGAIYLAFFLGIYVYKELEFKKNVSRNYEAISFINNFIISLSVTNSINATYEAMKENASETLKQQMSSIDHLNVETKIEYLNKYFNLPLYMVFVNIINQYVESGANILDISKLLIHDTRNLENRLHEFELVSHRKERDFIISWGFTFLILAVLELALSSFVTNVKDNITYYPILIFGYYLLYIGVYYGFINRIFDISFIYKGETAHEKTERKDKKIKFRFKKRSSATN